MEVRIVEAAAQLFARQGFKATTTREIANLADINEATLFYHFPNKLDLFTAAVESRLRGIKLGPELQSSLTSDSDLAVALPLLVTFFLETFAHPPELSRLLHVAIFEIPRSAKIIRSHLGPIYELVNGYFFRCAARGDLGSVDPSLATLGLVGALSAHQGWHQLCTGEPLPNPDSKEAIASYVQFWLQALKQPTAEPLSGDNYTAEEITV
jgi:AcrR family transcriptional regulator